MARGAREADARVKGFNLGHLRELAGSDVFVARLGTEAKPGDRFSKVGEGERSFLLVDARHCGAIKTEREFGGKDFRKQAWE